MKDALSGVDQALRAALSAGKMMTVFQPIWMVTGECWGFETLSRFPNGSPPDRVWCYAQQKKLAVALDRVAIKAAQAAVGSLGGALCVNVSSAHFREYRRLADLAHFPQVVWEVTENTALTPADLQGIRELKRQGFRIAMDDAGTEHSTVERLYRIQPDIVKLDRSVVQEWAMQKAEPLRHWIRCAQEIGAQVIAEGVEDAAWIVGLANEGVDAVQGYAMGRPAPREHWTIGVLSEYSLSARGGGG